MADPLSPATRTTKRNLLIASVIAISASAFNVSIDRIPVGGLSITFDDRLFAFLLVIVLLYFFLTFMLYYSIDIKNLEPTSHQTKAEENYKERFRDFQGHYFGELTRECTQLVPSEFYLRLDNAGHRIFVNDEPQPASYLLYKRGPKREVNLSAPEVEENYKEIFDAVRKHEIDGVRKFRRARFRHRALERCKVWIVRLMYIARNYILDGLLPIGLGIFAILTIFLHLDLSPIANHLPSFKELGTKHP